MQNTYHKQTAKFISAVIQNIPEMPADVMQSWIENPKALRRALAVLCTPEEASQGDFPTLKTIKLGTGFQTADDFRKAVEKAGMKIGDWANDILGKPALTVAESVTEVELVVASVAELGFKDGAPLRGIYVRAQELGLDLCPPEVGPQLRLQYSDQPKGEWLGIAMEPIADSGGGVNLFSVEHGGGVCWLGTGNGSPGTFWYGYNRFVFLSR